MTESARNTYTNPQYLAPLLNKKDHLLFNDSK